MLDGGGAWKRLGRYQLGWMTSGAHITSVNNPGPCHVIIPPPNADLTHKLPPKVG